MPKNPLVTIRPMESRDWLSVRAIFLEGIATGNATFETEAPDWAEWDSKHLQAVRLVAEAGGAPVGWAALSPVSSRCVYSGVAELSIYVAAAMRGKGVGKALLAAVIAESEAKGYWTLRSGVFPENQASIALHRKFGFRIMGTQERIGKMGDRWRDVVILERRSTVAGR
jgi:L-amino acid N-acyltransferase YncA